MRILFRTETTREKEWDNIAACHRGLATVTTWSYNRSTMGDLKLRHDRFKTEFTSAVAQVITTYSITKSAFQRFLFHVLKSFGTFQCVHLSTCGNFVFIGYDSGHVDKYNIQSGLHRGSFGSTKGKSPMKIPPPAHPLRFPQRKC